MQFFYEAKFLMEKMNIMYLTIIIRNNMEGKY